MRAFSYRTARHQAQAEHRSSGDRHANIGAGEFGDRGCSSFLPEPGFEPLSVVLETQGPERQGPTREELEDTAVVSISVNHAKA